jgi:dihydrofolate reductase
MNPSERSSVHKEPEMRKVIADEWLTLDGVIRAPGQPDEDPSGGFRHGGWHLGYVDDLILRQVADSIITAGGFLLGRRTYEIFAAHWPNAAEEEQVLAEPLNSKPKYVATRTLAEPLAWQHATVLQGDVADAVAGLKQETARTCT